MPRLLLSAGFRRCVPFRFARALSEVLAGQSIFLQRASSRNVAAGGRQAPLAVSSMARIGIANADRQSNINSTTVSGRRDGAEGTPRPIVGFCVETKPSPA
jgi:hypothetical protein